MKLSKVPPDAFALYVAMGPDRSYEQVGKHYGLHKRTVLRAARRDRWQERLEEIERQAQQDTDAKLAKSIHEANMRHRRLLTAVAARAAQALAQFELKSAMEAVRAAEVAVKLERLMLGEATETRSISVEQVSRDEISRLLVAGDDASDDWDAEAERDEAELEESLDDEITEDDGDDCDGRDDDEDQDDAPLQACSL